jgi:outer membrane protein TolC
MMRYLALVLPLFLFLFLIIAGCASAEKHRVRADRTAQAIIEEKQKKALGKTELFTIEKPSDTLRRRLILGQDLLYSSPISLGLVYSKPIEHWPDDSYLSTSGAKHATVPWQNGEPYNLTLMDALQIGARNSREYQDEKEEVFRAALALDLERNEFQNIFSAGFDSTASADLGGVDVIAGSENSGTVTLDRTLKRGLDLTVQMGLDLVNLLTMDRSSSLGLFADATISIPLLRGSGKHIVMEPLIQAERDVVYAIYQFERFKRIFAVQIAGEYLEVLRLQNQIENAEENYRSLISSTRRARRLADAGRISEIQVDQAKQDELRARSRWISAQQSYERQLDSLKILLGLPTNARISLDREELVTLRSSIGAVWEGSAGPVETSSSETPPADAPVELFFPDQENAGPLEIEESEALKLALENRLDMRIAMGDVYDRQRGVVVAADALRSELTLLGSANMGERRSVSTADSSVALTRPGMGFYSALLSFDFALERSSERNDYRNSLIDMERSVRDMQDLEDDIKLDVRNRLRDLLESRESLNIQATAENLARKRVKSANLFLKAGLVQIRDLLEAQEALISAQNAFTSALVTYRLAELQLQRDMGVLEVNEKGMWREYVPGE